MSKIIVTGGAGFIGSHLVDKLIEQGNEVVVIDNLSTGQQENVNPKAKFHNLDICSFEEIKPLFEGVDVVFHLAARPRVPFSVEDPLTTSQANILGSVSVFKAAADAKVRRVVFSGSSSVYGSQSAEVLSEEMPTSPLSPYALQKLTSEKFAKLFTNLYNIPIITLRYFNVFGSRIVFDSDYSLVIGKFLQQNQQGKPLTIHGDGEQTRGFTFIDDVVRATILASQSDKLKGGEIINIGSDKAHSINRLAELIGGKNVQKEFLPPRVGDPLHSKADISRAKELLDWQPEVSFGDGVKKTQEWFEEVSK